MGEDRVKEKPASERAWMRILEEEGVFFDGNVELRAGMRPVDPAFETSEGAKAHSEKDGAYAKILPSWGASRLMAVLREDGGGQGPKRIAAYAMITPPWTSGAKCADSDPNAPLLGLVGCWTRPDRRGRGLGEACLTVLLKHACALAAQAVPDARWRAACEVHVLDLVARCSPVPVGARVDPLSLLEKDRQR